MKLQTLFGLLLLSCAAWPSHAEVADSAAGGFTIKVALNVQASPHDLYTKLLHISEWWTSDHTWSGDARNLSLDADAKGCFCEKLPGGGSVRHMDVVFVQPDKMLVMRGALGPLMSMAALGAMTITISPAPGGAKLDVVFAVTGYQPGGINALAAPVDGVVSALFRHLKEVAEQPAAASKK